MTRISLRRYARRLRWASSLVAVCAALGGCASHTDVSVTASVKTQYSHAWLTVQGIWFNTSATATPEDTTWVKFSVATPITIDLASLSGGTLAQIASSLLVPPGTYAQVRLIPIDSSAALASSASAAGALFNAEADYVDTAGTTHQAPLELLNPDKGIGLTTTLTIKPDTSAVLGTATTTSTTDSNTTTDSTTAAGTATIDPTTGLPTTSEPATSNDTVAATPTTTTAPPVSIAINLDGVHDLVQFTYGTQTGILLNPHASAFDVSTTGTVRGQIDLTNIASSVESSGKVDVEVTAESLSTDGSRHVAVKTVQVASDGSFAMYPLSTSSSSATTYDLVIHGPQIATAIIKSVPVSVGGPATSSAVTVGTVTLRSATAFSFNFAPDTLALPAGALVNLYQTLPGSGEVPYLVEQTPVDPFSRALFDDQLLPTGTIDSGTYVSGGNVGLTAATPVQGASTYLLSAQAPLFADGALTTSLPAPSGGTGRVLVTPPVLSPAAGAPSSSVTVTVIPTTPGKYDHGELIISHDGGIVQTVAIDSALAQNGGATLLISGLPGGGAGSSFDNAVYYVSARAWNSQDPAGTLHRESYTTPVDLRSGSVTGLSVNVD